MKSLPGAPSPYARAVTLFDDDEPLRLEGGGTLTGVRVSYETYGRPHGRNTVFVCHALTGDPHPARHDADDRPGWWEAVIGPDRPIDTRVFHVVCANVLGGCAGTTGPWAAAPSGSPFGTGFPDVTVGDMVTVHRRLIAHIGVTGLHAVVGGSLGGMQALHWLLRYPADARRYLIIAGSARLSADNLAANAIGRIAIRSDPAFNGGRYRPDEAPTVGLGLARMIGHLTYLSAAALDDKFGRDLTPAVQTAAIRRLNGDVAHGPFAVESYLEHQAAKLVARFDANSYLYLTQAMDRFDAFADPPRPVADAGAIAHLFSFASDRLFGLSHSLRIRDGLRGAGLTVHHYHDTTSRAGHDAFLLPVASYLDAIRRALYLPRPQDQAVIAGVRTAGHDAEEAVAV